MPNRVGHVLVVEHPHFANKHVLVLVLEQTKSTFLLKCWNVNYHDWEAIGEPKRRAIGFLIDLGEVTKFTNSQLMNYAGKLASWHGHLKHQLEKATRDYETKVRSLKVLEENA